MWIHDNQLPLDPTLPQVSSKWSTKQNGVFYETNADAHLNQTIRLNINILLPAVAFVHFINSCVLNYIVVIVSHWVVLVWKPLLMFLFCNVWSLPSH